jgi:UDP-GlcNAc:undecaprenyl-phosphate GlcNAc-1-phosphate transferase
MIILSVMRADYLPAIYFAALGGAVLGFLRYNFNPATVFLGDGGSYFLGYAVAALSIMGSVKSQVGALMLIPLLALGVPVFDTVLAPVRRFVRGRRIFQPDRGHIHHKLLAMGLSSRNAVLVLYGVTVALCVLAILIVNLRNEAVGLFLVILGAGFFILMRKTGYLEYLAMDKFYGWFRDVADVTGFSHERRTFLAVQLEANKTQSIEELWTYVGEALEMLKFDRAELHYGTEAVRSWTRAAACRPDDARDGSLLRIEIPLSNGDTDIPRKLILLKDVKQGPLQPYTLRRVEHLRRTLLSSLSRLKK